MEINASTAGVVPGGLNNTDQIKLLVCYLLKSYGKLSRETIVESAVKDGLANYFEMHNAINNLLSKGHIIESETKDFIYLQLTDSGNIIISQLESSLPRTVREKATKAAMDILTIIKRERETNFEFKQENNSCYLYCTINDGNLELTTIKLLVPNKETADIIKNQLIKTDPSLVFHSVVALLTGDIEAFTEYFNHAE